LVTKDQKVVFGNNVFEGQKSFIMPKRKLQEIEINRHMEAVPKDIPSNSVAAGNPARVKCTIRRVNRK
jgi:maltose O-acetyltransferase